MVFPAFSFSSFFLPSLQPNTQFHFRFFTPDLGPHATPPSITVILSNAPFFSQDDLNRQLQASASLESEASTLREALAAAEGAVLGMAAERDEVRGALRESLERSRVLAQEIIGE
jgi:hypothetical protein